MKMKALVCREYGLPEVLEEIEVERASLKPKEIRVRVHAAGVGFVDGLLIQGKYQVKPPLPYFPGSEFSGEIIEVGDSVEGLKTGQAVMGLAGNGTFSEEVVVNQAQAFPLPSDLSHATAASLFINYATALYGLRDCGNLESGETILILGAAGGVGSAAIAMAKALGGTVIAAASSDDKRSAALRFGADETVDYTQENWRDELKSKASQGLNLVYDPVGGSSSESAFRSLSPGGRHLVVGFAAGDIPAIPLNLALLKRSSIVGVDWGGEYRENPAINQELMSTIFEWITSGRLIPAEPVVRPMADVRQALTDQLAGQIVGKLVLTRA